MKSKMGKATAKRVSNATLLGDPRISRRCRILECQFRGSATWRMGPSISSPLAKSRRDFIKNRMNCKLVAEECLTLLVQISILHG